MAREFTREEMIDILDGLVRSSRELGPPKPHKLKCGTCEQYTLGTLTCKLYPDGIPEEILDEEETCPKYRKRT